MTNFRIGLLGHGTVGSAFAQLLLERADQIAKLTGRRPELVGTLTRSRGDFSEILERSELIVELIGGIDPAREYVLEALRCSRHVVTANKQLLSQYGGQLLAQVRQSGVQLRFEPSVAGVVPAIRVVQESLAGAYIERVHGIVNGTTNYILTEMARTGVTFDQALADAQQLGFAEADPSDDVSGADAAAKMAILARLAFGGSVCIDDVVYEGVEQITPDDIEYAAEMDLHLKLIGTAERIDSGLSVRVHPVFLYSNHPLASVNGSFNAVTVESPAITEITLSGPGAGGIQTASAVLGDVVSIMTAPASLPYLELKKIKFIRDITSIFYLHLEVVDRPGVLVGVVQALTNHGVSIKTVNQKGIGSKARLVMVVHPVRESQFFAALKEIKKLEFIRSQPRAIRVIEERFGE